MNAFGYERELAQAYYKLLTAIDWKDEIIISGLREGLNKFLSNAHLSYFPGHKYHKTHFVSLKALDKLQRKDHKGLVFEHLVPKRKYLQAPCEKKAAEGTLTIDFIEDLLKSYWLLATVTKDEDATLSKNTMPDDWDEKALLARYETAGVKLVDNPFFSGSKWKENT